LANKEIKEAVVVAGERSAAHADEDKARDKYLCAYLVSGKK
jgi:hypothetical protein